MTEYEQLANAIILRAVEDYRKALWKLDRFEDDIKALSTVREVERFFRSKWFSILSSVDAERLLNKIKEERI